jgi:hypothetical protein
MKKTIILIGIITLITIISVNAYEYTITENVGQLNMTEVNTSINGTIVNFQFLSYTNFCKGKWQYLFTTGYYKNVTTINNQTNKTEIKREWVAYNCTRQDYNTLIKNEMEQNIIFYQNYVPQPTYFEGDIITTGSIKAEEFLDNTPSWKTKNLSANKQKLLAIKDTTEGKIDHASYPQEAISQGKRSIGATVTWLIELIKGIFQTQDQQQQEINTLKTELCKKDKTYKWCTK